MNKDGADLGGGRNGGPEEEGEPEVSPGGSRMVRHRDRPMSRDDATSAIEGHEHVESEEMQAFDAELTRRLGSFTVLHEWVSPFVHVDLYLFPPNEDFGYWRVITRGMSDLPQTVPEGAEEWRHVETVQFLAADTPGLPAGRGSSDAVALKGGPWQLGVQKRLARFPHALQTWLGAFHTVPNDDPPEPYDRKTLLTTAMFLPAGMGLPEDFGPIEVGGKTIRFLWLTYLTDAECALKLEHGADALVDRLDASGTDLVPLDPARPCAVTGARPRSRRPWWRFW